MKKTVFLYSGEGTPSRGTPQRLLHESRRWRACADILRTTHDLELDRLWEEEIGRHRGPFSPLLTVVAQVCLADLWQRWGFRPDIVLGHSTGELAAAHEAGSYTLEETLGLAFRIGDVAARLEGVMLHGPWPEGQLGRLPVYASSHNFRVEGGRHVTVSGYGDQMEAFHQAHPEFVRMPLVHPWHHPDYARFAHQLPPTSSRPVRDGVFVSGVTGRFETSLPGDYWRRWLTSPIDFIAAMQAVQARAGDEATFIEIGFHPVLESCCRIFRDHRHVSSMHRGEDDLEWILFQRRRLDPAVLQARLREAVATFKPDLDFGISLAYQGLGSLQITALSAALQPYFPGLAPQDLYRHKTIRSLIDGYRAARPAGAAPRRTAGAAAAEVVVAGMSCRFPAAAETLTQFWQSLMGGEDQVRPDATRGASAAGYLGEEASRFDHHYFQISAAEARTMDPQQILALELTEMLWRDAGIDPETLDKQRVGVYLGVWSQEYRGDRASVYYPTGTNPSLVAARISYHYDLRGPSWVSNTACSSSLVAVHYAAQDIAAGRIDFAIAGGVNMLLDEVFSDSMRQAGFLSADDRCKAFDDSANGYVRAEGGGLVLLANKALVERYYAILAGSAVNQNGRRPQLITAPHPEAQEELILAACADAGVRPQDIAFVECHGTGTRIGDPIEIAALQNTVARNRTTPCYIGSVKSNIGHLESAAGIAGLIKAIAGLSFGTLPPNLHFDRPNRFIDFSAHNLQVVTAATPIDPQALAGVSSFGFGGTNAHVIVQGAEGAVRKAIRPLEVPFDRTRAAPLESYLRRSSGAPADSASLGAPTGEDQDVRRVIQTLFVSLTGQPQIDPDVELVEQGLDSMSATELVHQLEEQFQIAIEPEMIFEHPTFERFAAEIERRVAQALSVLN